MAKARTLKHEARYQAPRCREVHQAGTGLHSSGARTVVFERNEPASEVSWPGGRTRPCVPAQGRPSEEADCPFESFVRSCSSIKHQAGWRARFCSFNSRHDSHHAVLQLSWRQSARWQLEVRTSAKARAVLIQSSSAGLASAQPRSTPAQGGRKRTKRANKTEPRAAQTTQTK